MTAEVIFALAYSGFLLACAFGLEGLSQHTHRRSLRFRTAGFTYHRDRDAWECPEGEHLWPHAYDHERRLVRYRAKAHICNGCPRKEACTDSDVGREVVRAVDPWPHSEAGRFHRGVSLMLVALAAMILCVEVVRNHAPVEVLALGTLGLLTALAARRLLADFHAQRADFPEPTPSHGLRLR